MNVPSFWHTWKLINACAAMYTTCPSPCSHISCGYPKRVWLIYVYNVINYNACAYRGIKIFLQRIAIDTYVYVTGFGKTGHNVTFDISRNTNLKY